MTDIRLENITKIYGAGAGATTAVENVTLSIRSGEFFFLLGPSGCGKTTLLRIIAGLVEPSGGRVFFGQRDVSDLSVERRNSAMVFQNYALWPHMSVMQNVEFGPKMHGRSRQERRRIALDNLARVQMEGYVRRRPNQLSGGQQQRVALARALAAQGECLLLDEPLSNLDARLRLHMRGELRRLVKESGVTAVYVTHDQKEALSMADRIAVMNAGRIVQVGPPEQLYNRPSTRFVADFLGEANFVSGRLVAVGAVARVQTEIGTLLADRGENSTDQALAAGAGVTCCVRPERIGIFPPGAAETPGAALLPATVVSSVYLGEIRQYACRLGQNVVWKVFALAHRTAAIELGQAVSLTVEAQDVAILPD